MKTTTVTLTEREMIVLVTALETAKLALRRFHDGAQSEELKAMTRNEHAEIHALRNKLRDAKSEG